jgi:hypothetical protein
VVQREDQQVLVGAEAEHLTADQRPGGQVHRLAGRRGDAGTDLHGALGRWQAGEVGHHQRPRHRFAGLLNGRAVGAGGEPHAQAVVTGEQQVERAAQRLDVERPGEAAHQGQQVRVAGRYDLLQVPHPVLRRRHRRPHIGDRRCDAAVLIRAGGSGGPHGAQQCHPVGAQRRRARVDTHLLL